MAKPNHYVDNRLFFDSMRKYKEECYAAKAAGLQRPTPSNYIGTCFYLMSSKLASRANFVQYPFKEEMISDAILNCVKYVDRFDEKHPKASPFSYFNRIIWNSFVKRIETEHDELYARLKSEQHNRIFDEDSSDISGEFGGNRDGGSGSNRRFGSGDLNPHFMKANDFIAWYEENRAKKLAIRKSKAADKKAQSELEGIDLLMEEGDGQ